MPAGNKAIMMPLSIPQAIKAYIADREQAFEIRTETSDQSRSK